MVFLRLLLGGLLSVAVAAVLARTLSPSDFGVYLLVALIPTAASIGFGLGLAPSAVYFVSRNDRRHAPTASLLMAVNFYLGIIILIFSGLFLVFTNIGDELGNYSTSLLIVIAAIPFFLLNTCFISILQGIKDFKMSGVVAVMPNFLFIFFLYLLDLKLASIVTVVTALFVATHIVTFCFVWFVRPKDVSFFILTRDAKKFFTRDRRSYIGFVYIGNLVAFLNGRALIYLIGFLQRRQMSRCFLYCCRFMSSYCLQRLR